MMQQNPNMENSNEQLISKAKAGDSFAQFQVGLKFYFGADGFDQDYTKAVDWYRKSGYQKNPHALCNLGACYQYGLGVPQDYKQAADLYEKAAELGVAAAQNNLAILFENGWGVERNYDRAFKLFTNAADQGDASAQNNLATMYRKGLSTTQDFQQAVALYRKSAEQGNDSGQCNLGWMYQWGLGVAKDAKKAVELYERAAQQHNFEAIANLAYCYEHGIGVPTDMRKAVDLYEEAAHEGNPKAQNNLGLLYKHGRHVPKDEARATQLFLAAAEENYAAAQCNVGLALLEQKPKNPQKAVHYFTLAAEQQHPVAMFNLAYMLRNGYGVSQPDYKRAAELFEQAAIKGNMDAANNLGLMYQRGEGVPQDNHRAVEWFQKGANKGFPLPQCNLAWMYYFGDGVAQNYKRALEWYQLAAVQGNAAAQRCVGVMLLKGVPGVPRDPKRGVECLEKAVKQGDICAHFNLGLLLEKGWSVMQDIERARSLYEIASTSGNSNAQNNLAVLLLNDARVQFPEGSHLSTEQQLHQQELEIKAVQLLEAAVKSGNPLAQNNLAVLLESGICSVLSVDEKRALELFERAAKQGVPAAKACLAKIYEEHGSLGSHKQLEIKRLLNEAADGGVLWAKEKLRMMQPAQDLFVDDIWSDSTSPNAILRGSKEMMEELANSQRLQQQTQKSGKTATTTVSDSESNFSAGNDSVLFMPGKGWEKSFSSRSPRIPDDPAAATTWNSALSLPSTLEPTASSMSQSPFRELTDTPILNWDLEHVCRWLRALPLSQDYTGLVKENNITGVVLCTMKKEDWNDLGLTKFGDVRIIQTALKQFV